MDTIEISYSNRTGSWVARFRAVEGVGSTPIGAMRALYNILPASVVADAGSRLSKWSEMIDAAAKNWNAGICQNQQSRRPNPQPKNRRSRPSREDLAKAGQGELGWGEN